MTYSKNKKKKYLFIIFAIIMVTIMAYAFFKSRTKISQKPVMKEKLMKKETHIAPEKLQPSPKEKKISPERFTIKLDDLDTVKGLEKRPDNKDTKDSQNIIFKNKIDGTWDKKSDGTVIYKKGKIRIKGSGGFIDSPEKNDSLDDLKDKAEIKGDIGVEF